MSDWCPLFPLNAGSATLTYMFPLSLITLLLIVAKTAGNYFLHKKHSFRAACIDGLIFIPKIFSQQVALYALFLAITFMGISTSYTIALCATLFALAHLYLLRTLRRADALVLIASSAFGGALFVYLYITYVHGLWLAFLAHLAFHTLLDVVYVVMGLGAMRGRVVQK